MRKPGTEKAGILKPGTEKAGVILHVRNIASFQHFFVVFDNSKTRSVFVML
jgi:hypothetical protein